MMHWNNGAWGAGDWVAMSLMMLVLWGLIVAVVFSLVRGFAKNPKRDDPSGQRSAGADEVLAERFARGEIDENEFTQRRELLHTPATAPSRTEG